MVTKEQAMKCRHFVHVSMKNADGSRLRCRANGKCKTWVTRPDEFRLPVKHGLKDCFYITLENAKYWEAVDKEIDIDTNEEVPITLTHEELGHHMQAALAAEESFICPNCKGSGTVTPDPEDPDQYNLCPKCNGNGRPLTVEQIKQMFSAKDRAIDSALVIQLEKSIKERLRN